MSFPLLYSNNAEIKYPISDFDENEIPTDILLDLSLSVPEAYTPIISAIRISPFTAFVAIVNQSDGLPLATAIVQSPATATVYPLQMDVEGFGWVVFGPGLSNDYYSGDITAELDPETWVAMKTTAPVFDIEVNGYSFDLANILGLLVQNDILTLTVDGDTVYIDRNDSVLSEAEIAAFSDFVASQDSPTIQSVGGTPPDETGNLDIIISGCAANCDDVWSLQVPRGDVGEGTGEELPLDALMPRQYTPCEACLPSNLSSSAGDTDPFDGCQVIVRKDILDPADDHAIGTLYTVSDE